MQTKSIYEFKDYRLFLQEIIQNKRNDNPKLSYRIISKKIGFSSPNFILLVMQGKRNLSPVSIERLGKFLELNKTEKNYFKNLVLMNQAANFEDKLEFSKKLLSSKLVSEKKHITPELLSYYSSWLNIVVREMTLLANFESDPAWLTDRLNHTVTKKEIEAALETLLKLGLIQKNANKYVATDKDIRAPSELRSDFIRAFHLEMILKASKSLTDIDTSLRDITSVTVPITLDMIPDLKKRIEEFRSSITEAVKSAQPTEVYQLNIQLFPLTKITKA
jgi:uncharacterized protein (TIGR02147 family)